jgi:hypothetical protein
VFGPGQGAACGQSSLNRALLVIENWGNGMSACLQRSMENDACALNLTCPKPVCLWQFWANATCCRPQTSACRAGPKRVLVESRPHKRVCLWQFWANATCRRPQTDACRAGPKRVLVEPRSHKRGCLWQFWANATCRRPQTDACRAGPKRVLVEPEGLGSSESSCL